MKKSAAAASFGAVGQDATSNEWNITSHASIELRHWFYIMVQSVTKSAILQPAINIYCLKKQMDSGAWLKTYLVLLWTAL